MTGSHLVPVGIAQEAADLVDASGVVELVNGWMKQDQSYRGGRPTSLSLRTLLIAWLVVALEEAPLHIKRVAEVLTVRSHPAAAEIMGAPDSFIDLDPAKMYGRIHNATQRLLDHFDSKPLPTRKGRLTKAQWAEVEQERLTMADELEKKRRRFFLLANELFRAQHESLADALQTDRVSLTVDATFLSANGKGMGKKKLEKRRDDQKVSSEPDGGFYIRTYEQSDRWDGSEEGALRKRGFGWEYELVALISNDPAIDKAVPHIVIGFNHHRPGVNSNESAREIFDHILERGLGLHHVVGDQAYFPGAKAEVLQNHLRANGARLVMKYSKPSEKSNAKGEGTIQAQANGAVLVEGRWYCPALTSKARLANAAYRQAVTADRGNPTLTAAERQARAAQHAATRDQSLDQRKLYEMRQKETKANGTIMLVCPAAGGSPTLACPFKENKKFTLPEGAVRLPVVRPPATPQQVCKTQSTAFDPDAGGKYRQHYRYGTEQWHVVHSYGRQVIESFNNSMKHAQNSLHDRANRCLRGETAQAFLAVLAVMGTNARHIAAWQDHHGFDVVAAPEGRTRDERTVRHDVAPSRGRKGVSARRAAQLGLDAARVSSSGGRGRASRTR
jgi:hypothetical protein